jgi:hypothetical protein
MEENLNILDNVRQSLFFSNVIRTQYFGKWKTISKFNKWKLTSKVWQIEDGLNILENGRQLQNLANGR